MVEFGLFNESGAIERDTETCAISGHSVETGDALVRVKGTRLFFRVSATELYRLTPEVRSQIEAQAPKPVVTVSAKKSVDAPQEKN